MKSKSTKALCLIISALMLSSVFVSCANNEDDGNKPLVTGVRSENNGDEPTFEDYTFEEGETFVIAGIGPDEANFADCYIACEERNGDPINDAVVDRNEAVFDKYNITIERTKDMNVEKAAKTGTADFEVVYNWGIRLARSAVDGYFYDFTQIPNIDLTQSYWVPSAQKDLVVADKLLIAPCDISMNHIAHSGFVIFNKDILDRYNVAYPYDLVQKNEWTFDNYMSIALACGDDVNGDTILDTQDVYGSNMGIGSLIECAGISVDALKKDDEGNYTVDINTDKIMTIFNKYNKTIATHPVNFGKMTNPENMPWIKGRDISEYSSEFVASRVISFGEGHYALEGTRMGFLSEFKDVEDLNYGVVPNPKMDSSQQEYYHFVDTCAPMFSVMKGADMDKVGIVMEYCAYQSSKLLLPAFYDKSVKTKRLWDDRDAQMCDIIKDSTHYSMTGLYYLTIVNVKGEGWDPIGTMLSNMAAAGNTKSIVQKYQSAAQSSIDDFYDKIFALDLDK